MQNPVNLDLTATKKFGPWEIGAVAHSARPKIFNQQVPTYLKQSQFAVGGLVGYDFGPFSVQAYVTTDVAEEDSGGEDTRGILRVRIPLGNPLHNRTGASTGTPGEKILRAGPKRTYRLSRDALTLPAPGHCPSK